MSPGRCNTGLTTPRHAEYQTYQSDLEEYYTTHQAMPSDVPVDRWEGVDGLQFVSQAYPTMLYWIQVRTGVVIHKQTFSTHGAPKQTYMLFQNDIPIDVACNRYTLNMQISSGTKNNSSSNEPSFTNVTVSFNVVSLDGNEYLCVALSILKSGENQTAN
ncbi:uncharacterized protein TNCV_4506001 [Trichonephila clavipes]|nr:uncharacterized protein TNCV_4506001 [Trichonephila clavipes]